MSAPKAIVCIVNGYARAGKDTFIGFLGNELTRRGVLSAAFSSIEPVRDMLRSAGFPVDIKTPEMRRLLSEVGDSVELFNQFKTAACAREAERFFNGQPVVADRVIFLHTREPEIIDRIGEVCAVKLWGFTTIFLESNRGVKDLNNKADREVESYRYALRARNNGTLGQLYDEAVQTVDVIMGAEG
jgi:hypothetical protein